MSAVVNKGNRYVDISVSNNEEIIKNPDLESHNISYWVTFIYIIFVTFETFLRKFLPAVKKDNKDGIFKNIIRITDLKFNSILFDKLSDSLMFLRKNKASYAALDLVYHWKFGANIKNKKRGLKKLIEDIAFNCKVSIGVRNRFEIVKFSLLESVLIKKRKRIISIAAGSGEAVILAIAKAKKQGYHVDALFIDMDENALFYAKNLAEKFEVSKNVTFLHKSISDSFRDIILFKPDLIEMTGIIDYFSDENLKKFLKFICRQNADVLTSNVTKRPGFISFAEKMFLTITIDWPMFYRTRETLSRIFEEVGFDAKFITEPMGMYTVVSCVKK